MITTLSRISSKNYELRGLGHKTQHLFGPWGFKRYILVPEAWKIALNDP